MTPLLTKWRELEKWFDLYWGEAPPGTLKFNKGEAIKSHHRQSLIAIIEGEIERLRVIKNDPEISNGYFNAIKDQISYYQSTLEGLRK